MTLITRAMSIWRWIRHRDRAEQQLDAELRAFLACAIADKVRDGVPLEEARRQARLELGGTEQVKEQVRRSRHGGGLDEVWRDLRHAIRLLVRTPGFTGVVVVTLALGIGANTAIFSVIDALLLRWLPVRAPHELVQLSLHARQAPDEEPGGSVSYAMVRALAEQRDVFSGVGGFSAFRFDVGPPDAVARVPGALVTGGFFETLGLQPQAGRLLAPADDAPGAAPAAILSDGYWARQFDRRGDAIGRTLLLNGVAVPIVGVAPRGFVGATVGATAEITIAVAALPLVAPSAAPILGPGNFWLRALARPRDGLSIRQVTDRLDAIWARLAPSVLAPHWPASQRAEAAAMVFRLRPGGTGWSYLRVIYRTPLVVLMGVVGVVLLIACANVASLLLARATGRQREMTLRLALGAGRARLVRQLLTEGLLLAITGGTLGVALAWMSSRALVQLMSTPLLSIDIDVTPNPRILAFTAGVAVATALLFATAPALRATSGKAATTLATDVRGTRQRSRWLPVLVVVQIALALLLLAGAGLFARTFYNLQHVDAGFHAEGVVFAELDAGRIGSRDLVVEIAGLPGVLAAATATHTPLSGNGWSEPFVPAGQPLPDKDTAMAIGASPGYFETLGIRIVSGRGFESHDVAGGLPVAVVNEAFVRRHLPGQAAVGQRLSAKIRGTRRDLTIVGLAADTRTRGLRVPAPATVYLALAQLPGDGPLNLLVRGAGSPAALVQALEPALRAAMPGAPVEIEPLAVQIGASIVRERVLALLAAGFGLLALLLAGVGLYGLMAYGVTQRIPELGVRLALGARRGQILALVLTEAGLLVAGGVALGVPAAWLATRWVGTLLFGVTPADPASALAAIALLTGAALLAAYLPARRAAGVDPLVALRHE